MATLWELMNAYHKVDLGSNTVKQSLDEHGLPTNEKLTFDGDVWAQEVMVCRDGGKAGTGIFYVIVRKNHRMHKVMFHEQMSVDELKAKLIEAIK